MNSLDDAIFNVNVGIENAILVDDFAIFYQQPILCTL